MSSNSNTPVLILAISAAAATTAVLFVLSKKALRKGPLGYRSLPKPYEPVQGRVTDISRDAFKKKKLPEDIDYVVVGSGISGLYTSALLAKLGYKVVCLEQHYVTGGCSHAFEEHGYEFDTGLHYVGRIEKYKQMFDFVSLDKKVEWAKIGSEADGYCYDEIKLGNEAPFKFPAGEAALIGALVKEFPEEEEGIKNYFAFAKKVNKSADLYFFAKLFNPIIQWILKKTLNHNYIKWSSTTTEDVVCSYVSNKRLRALLCGQFGNYGLIPSQSSFLIHAGVAAHYMDGGYYPVGGSQEISRAIIPTIERSGGRVFVKAPVKEIVVKNGKALGVLMEDGTAVKAKHGVISSAGIKTTHDLVSEKYKSLLGFDQFQVEPGTSHVVVFVGLKGDAKELKLGTGANLWHLPVDEEYNFVGPGLKDEPAKNPDDPWDGVVQGKDLLLFIGFPSTKDPDFDKNFPGKSTCEIITQCPTQWFTKYLDENEKKNQSGKRKNRAYDKLKLRIQELILERFYQLYPQCKGKVDYVEVGTPLSNLYYLGHADSYGLEHTPERYSGALDKLRPETNIKNLFITGQDVASVGIAGALNSGILTAHAVVGYGVIDLVFLGRNLITDLMALEK